MIIETTSDGLVSLHIPASPILVQPATAEDIKAKIGAAIGVATGQTP